MSGRAVTVECGAQGKVADAKGHTASQIEISPTRAPSLLSQFGSHGGTDVNLLYKRNY